MSQDSYSIYQVPDGDEFHGIRYMRLQELRDAGVGVQRANYELVYHAGFTPGELLTDEQVAEKLYRQFTTDCPLDFAGNPVGMGDVVVLRRDGEASAYYCDYASFEEVPEFISGPFRYYSTQRPIDVGTLPKTVQKPEAIVNYDSRMEVENGQFEAWGVVQYAQPLLDKDIEAYELRPSSYNADVAVMPPRQLAARLQVVGQWETENAVPEKRRLTEPVPGSGGFRKREGASSLALNTQFRVISRRHWRGIEAQLQRGKQQADKNNAARPPKPKYKGHDR